MPSFSSIPSSGDAQDLAADVVRLFDELARRRPDRRPLVAGECTPLLDVFETQRHVEIVLDVPGVSAGSLRVLVKSGAVLVVGEKERSEPALRRQASYHLVERDFGRFARAARIHRAVDAARATAHLSAGELRIVLPKISERRGQGIVVPVTTAGAP